MNWRLLCRWPALLRWAVWLAVSGVCTTAALAQPAPAHPNDDAAFFAAIDAQRGQIATQREQAEQRFNEQEFGCWKRFAVNDCLQDARRERRQALHQLREQELELNAAARKRRVDKRLRAIAEKEQRQGG